jgi:hypothetical protein
LQLTALNVHIFFILGHPRFLNQLSTGLDVIGIAGEMLRASTIKIQLSVLV